MSKIFIGRFVASILALLIASSVLPTRGQSQNGVLSSYEDEAEIFEWMIHFEIKPQFAEFGRIGIFSTDNISSVLAKRISKHGFSLMTPGEIQRLKQERVFDYMVIRSIYLKGGLVVVSLSTVTEGSSCFAPSFSRERCFTYEFKKSPTGWVGKLVNRPPPLHFRELLGFTR